ncbi:hypothetical protein CISG_07751 [Coccidioides immitis RMSCC 3703]|uniref:Uncharacterized protein n=2 Tax=Coccidioides immitis TaxID=5501 RepID=A0A0J8R2E2_COCIT|nr:hypothetical protein CIRG_06479 [Coccidioides immitis RMSCC 2394]KMU79319.1 hypothetical protein CISG_07751 [Coccidioides immitis RMSCC 3703]
MDLTEQMMDGFACVGFLKRNFSVFVCQVTEERFECIKPGGCLHQYPHFLQKLISTDIYWRTPFPRAGAPSRSYHVTTHSLLDEGSASVDAAAMKPESASGNGESQPL